MTEKTKIINEIQDVKNWLTKNDVNANHGNRRYLEKLQAKLEGYELAEKELLDTEKIKNE